MWTNCPALDFCRGLRCVDGPPDAIFDCSRDRRRKYPRSLWRKTSAFCKRTPKTATATTSYVAERKPGPILEAAVRAAAVLHHGRHGCECASQSNGGENPLVVGRFTLARRTKSNWNRCSTFRCKDCHEIEQRPERALTMDAAG